MSEVILDLELLEQLAFDKLMKELGLNKNSFKSTVALLDEGNTIPFISRYRKEATGGLTETTIKEISEKVQYVRNLNQRKEEVVRSINNQGKLDEELKERIAQADKLQVVEDLYVPFKKKRRTRATIAKEKGLEPFADWILQFNEGNLHPEAINYINEELGVNDANEAVEGAQDIIAEKISEDFDTRVLVRELTRKTGKIETSPGKNIDQDEKGTYKTYTEFSIEVGRIKPHMVLAINRAEKEEVIKVKLDVDEESIVEKIQRMWVGDKESASALCVMLTIKDAYTRLIQPSVEREIRKELTEVAEEQAIKVFSDNLKNLLMQPPVRNRRILAIDPAYRTGCKLAVVNEMGTMLKVDVIYPTPPVSKVEEAKEKLMDYIFRFDIDIITIGNGTASRETEQFVSDLISEEELDVEYIIVNEAGASVYSASELAKQEFPGLNVEERSAVSIARRFQDPLSELVKIDPKSIGVGQYQHDVNQTRLEEELTFVVESAVNSVGVDVNTASVSLLQYVSGLNKTVANNIVKEREKRGVIRNREELKTVPRMGSKTYEQSIGFLRIYDGDNKLDETSIHPESYGVVDKVFRHLTNGKQFFGTPQFAVVKTLNEIAENKEELERIIGVSQGEIIEILKDLQKPRRDPRDDLPKPKLSKGITKIEDLTVGELLEGAVRNVVDFGAFVDIGLKSDALVHISKLADKFVRHPSEIVSVGDIIKVRVIGIELERDRVQLERIE